MYKQVGRLLEFVDGQEEERMLAISARTGEFLVDNFERKGNPSRTSFSEKEMRIINRCKDFLILVHNHSHNVRPSAQDILTYLYSDNVKISIVVCHDGTLYGIYGVKKEFEKVYNEYLQDMKNKIADEQEAKRIATTKIYILNEQLHSKHKLFNVVKL